MQLYLKFIKIKNPLQRCCNVVEMFQNVFCLHWEKDKNLFVRYVFTSPKYKFLFKYDKIKFYS